MEEKPDFTGKGVPTHLLNLDQEARNRLLQDKPSELGQNYQLQTADILCGNRLTRDYPGNARFNLIVQMRLDRYREASTKSEKSAIVKEIVDAARASGANFVKQELDGVWYDIGNIKAREKASNAIRTLMGGGARRSSGRASFQSSSDADAAAAAATTVASEPAERTFSPGEDDQDRRDSEPDDRKVQARRRSSRRETTDAGTTAAASAAHTSVATSEGGEGQKHKHVEAGVISGTPSVPAAAFDSTPKSPHGTVAPVSEAAYSAFSRQYQSNTLISSSLEALRQENRVPTPDGSPASSSGASPSGDKKKKSK